MVGYDKPNKNIFRYALRKLDVANDDCIMIGDSYAADIAGALRYGLKAILVRKDNERQYPWYTKRLDGIVEIVQSKSW